MDIWKRLTNFFGHPIIQLLGLPGVLAVITWIIIKLTEVPLWIIWLAILFSISCGFLILNQVGGWQERHKKKLSQLSDEEIEATIRNWLDHTAFKVQRQINNECLFKFESTDRDQRIVAISRPKARPMQIELGSAVMLGATHKIRYEALKPSDKNDIIHNLRIEMARFGVSFQGINTPLKFINIADIVLLDGLNEFYINQRILFMLRAICLLSEVISRQLDNINESISHKEGSLSQ